MSSEYWPDDPTLEHPSIQFDTEELSFQLDRPDDIASWIKVVIETHHGRLGQLQYVFCSDTYLHKLNVEHLKHDTLTDIITFPYQEPPVVEGDIFISVDRVRENAELAGTFFLDELHRVIIHGVLHLLGYADKSHQEQQIMRSLEDKALELREFGQ